MANIVNEELSSLTQEYGVKLDFIQTSSELPEGVLAQAEVIWTSKFVDGERVPEVLSKGISVNEQWWQSESQYRENLAFGFVDQSSHVGGAKPRHTVRHEFGHLLDRPQDRAATQEIFNRRKKDLFLISSYAASSREEMFAEAFAMYRQLGNLSNVGGADFSELEPFFKPKR